jgi:phosphatidylethanolamine-binding protein (PEBP) family uncharacterized protein
VKRTRSIVVIAVGLVSAALLVACSHDGRSLKPASPDQTLSIITTTVAPVESVAAAKATNAVAAPAGGGGVMSLNGSWEDGQALPTDSTCKGAGLSPDLSWFNVPPLTTELVLTVTDADATGFVQWILAGIDPATPGLVQGKVPRGTVQALNGKPSLGWTPPCPAGGTHRYVFSLFALTKPSGILAGMDPADAIAGLTAKASPHVSITGTVAA